jgi:hypothetical protein
VTRGPGPSLCLSLSWEPTVTTALSACPEVDDRSFVSAVNTPYLDQFIPAKQLKTGERLKTPNGTLATADGGTTPKVHDGWMWDLTVPGNNDHDFYVLAEPGGQGSYNVARNTPILVHNDNCSLTVPQRLSILYQRLHALPTPTTAEEALNQVNSTLTEVEDEFSGVPENPNPGLEPDGRMYPPREDNITQTEDGGLTAKTRGNIINISPDGSVTILSRRTGEIVYSREGGG